MLKKISALLIILFLILCISSNCFAMNKVENAMHTGVDTVMNGVESVGNLVKDGVNDVTTTTNDGINDVDNGVDNTLGTVTNNGNYNSARTSSDAYTTNGNNATNTLWIWIAVAIAAIVIIGLVWYYAAQDTTTNSRH